MREGNGKTKQKNTYLLDHAGALGDLSANVLIKQSLGQNLNCAVFALDAELLGLDVDTNRVNIVNATLAYGLGLDPFAQVIVDSPARALAIIVNIELALELLRQLSLTSADSLLAHVDSPVIVLNFDIALNGGSSGAELVKFIIAIVVAVGVAVFVRAMVGALLTAAGVTIGGAVLGSLLPGATKSLLLGLVLLATLALMLDNEAAELQAEVDVGALTAGLAVKNNAGVVDVSNGLRVAALLAENKFLDEAIEKVLQLGRLMDTVDDPAIILGVGVCLGTKLKGKVLDDVVGVTFKRLGNAGQVDDDGLDTVALSFHLGHKALHLVAIKVVADIATDVDESHDCGVVGWLKAFFIVAAYANETGLVLRACRSKLS